MYTEISFKSFTRSVWYYTPVPVVTTFKIEGWMCREWRLAKEPEAMEDEARGAEESETCRLSKERDSARLLKRKGAVAGSRRERLEVKIVAKRKD